MPDFYSEKTAASPAVLVLHGNNDWGIIMITKTAALQIIAKLGIDTKKNGANNSMLDAICRAAMRNPSDEAKVLIDDLKKSLALFFHDKTDESIKWVLSNATEKRGHFVDVAACRAYCDGRVKTLPSADIALIDGMLSGINYSSNSKILADDPAREGKVKIQQAIAEIIQGAPKYIGDTFTQRQGDMKLGRIERGGLTTNRLAKHNLLEEHEHLSAPNRTISAASGLDEHRGFLSTPDQLPKIQLFEKQGYAKLADEAGVLLVGHVSGTTPGNLAVANGLLKKHQQTTNPQSTPDGLTPAKAHTLAGSIAASFLRCGFHSPPEVLVGLRHYLGTVATEENVATTTEQMKQLFAESVTLIAGASSPQLKECISLIIDDLKETPNLTVKGERPASRLLEQTDVPGDLEPISESAAWAEIDELATKLDLTFDEEPLDVKPEHEEPDPRPEEPISLEQRQRINEWRIIAAQSQQGPDAATGFTNSKNTPEILVDTPTVKTTAFFRARLAAMKAPPSDSKVSTALEAVQAPNTKRGP